MKKGLFIAFEGIDGSGKSTQASMLFRQLKDAGIPAVLTREPGGAGSEICEKIRNIILNRKSTSMVWKTELLLFLASRAQHVEEIIIPHIEAGTHVICDRFADATIAYQGYGRGLDIGNITQLNGFACGDTSPALTVLLDIPTQEFVTRKKIDGRELDRIESAGVEFQARVRNGYLELSKMNPERFLVLDGTQNPGELASEVYKAFENLINNR